MSPIRTLFVLSVFGSVAFAEEKQPNGVVCRLEHEFNGGPPSFQAMTFSPDGKQLLTLSPASDGKLDFWDTRTGKLIQTKHGVSSRCNIRFSPDGRYLAAISDDPKRQVRIWEVATGKQRFPLKSDLAPTDWLSWGSDGKRIAAVRLAEKPAMEVWDFESRERLSDDSIEQPIVRCDYLVDGERFLTATSDRLFLFSPGYTEAKRFQPFPMHSGRGDYALSADRKFVLARSFRSKDARVYEVDSRLELCTLQHPGIPTCLGFAPHGRLMAIGCSNDRICLLDWPTGKQRISFPTQGPPLQLCFSPDGHRLASWERTMGANVVVLRDTGGISLDRMHSRASSQETLRKAWAALEETSSGQWAYAAISDLIADEDVERFIESRLLPAERTDRSEIAPSIRKLDDPRFPVRERAFRTLEEFGIVALPELRDELFRATSAEQTRTLQKLIDLASTEKQLPRRLREQRAVFVLERVGSPKCEAILRDLSKGASGHPLTEDAKRALLRLRKE